jgi:hypothetical protein
LSAPNQGQQHVLSLLDRALMGRSLPLPVPLLTAIAQMNVENLMLARPYFANGRDASTVPAAPAAA